MPSNGRKPDSWRTPLSRRAPVDEQLDVPHAAAGRADVHDDLAAGLRQRHGWERHRVAVLVLQEVQRAVLDEEQVASVLAAVRDSTPSSPAGSAQSTTIRNDRPVDELGGPVALERRRARDQPDRLRRTPRPGGPVVVLDAGCPRRSREHLVVQAATSHDAASSPTRSGNCSAGRRPGWGPGRVEQVPAVLRRTASAPVEGHDLPAVAVEGPVADALVVLLGVVGGDRRVVEARPKAGARRRLRVLALAARRGRSGRPASAGRQ